ncbi:hypothetical protein ACFXTH_018401 [Malus domestica]
MGPRRSMRLNVIIKVAPSLPGSTMATTAVATTVTITCSEVHGTATMAQAVPSKAHDTKAMAQVMRELLNTQIKPSC